MDKTPGQIAYEIDLVTRPNYPDGTLRKTWDELPDFARSQWEKGARYGAENHERE